MPDVRSGVSVPNVVWPGKVFRDPNAPKTPYRKRTSCASLGAFAVCPQLYGFGYEMGLGPSVEREATKIGSLVHVGLAYRYGMLMPQRPQWLVYPTPQAPDPRSAIWVCGQDTPELATEALRIYDAYAAYYPTVTWRPWLVEYVLEAEMPIPGEEPEPYTLRLDLVVVDEDGVIAIVDHKTVYKMSKWIGSNYRLDREMITALALARANGINAQRVIINAMTKETPTPKFERFYVPISESGYARLGQDTVYWIQQMRKVGREYPDPTNRPRAFESCMRKYGLCDFYPICSDGPHRIAEYKQKWGKKPLPVIGALPGGSR